MCISIDFMLSFELGIGMFMAIFLEIKGERSDGEKLEKIVEWPAEVISWE